MLTIQGKMHILGMPTILLDNGHLADGDNTYMGW